MRLNGSSEVDCAMGCCPGRLRLGQGGPASKPRHPLLRARARGWGWGWGWGWGCYLWARSAAIAPSSGGELKWRSAVPKTFIRPTTVQTRQAGCQPEN
jgi:hypothetical protein